LGGRHFPVLLLVVRAGALFAFNAKTPRWLDALRSMIWLAALLAARSECLFVPISIWWDMASDGVLAGQLASWRFNMGLCARNAGMG
jgi:hypothetical protein